MESRANDEGLFERLLDLNRPLVEAIWRQVIYGEPLETILAQLDEPGIGDDTGMGLQVRELVTGAYRHIRRVEAARAAEAN